MLFIHTGREDGYVLLEWWGGGKNDYNSYFIHCCDGGSVFAAAVRRGVYTGQTLLYVCTKGNTGGDKGKKRTFSWRPCAWLAADGAVFNDYVVGAFAFGGWDGIIKGFTFWQFFQRFLTMLWLLKAFDILFFDPFLLCHSNFFPHFYPEIKEYVGPQ